MASGYTLLWFVIAAVLIGVADFYFARWRCKRRFRRRELVDAEHWFRLYFPWASLQQRRVILAAGGIVSRILGVELARLRPDDRFGWELRVGGLLDESVDAMLDELLELVRDHRGADLTEAEMDLIFQWRTLDDMARDMVCFHETVTWQ